MISSFMDTPDNNNNNNKIAVFNNGICRRLNGKFPIGDRSDRVYFVGDKHLRKKAKRTK